MSWLFTAALTVVLVELLLRLPLIPAAREVAETGRLAVHVMSSTAISDHWKEKAARAYSARMLGASLKLLAGLGAVGLMATLSIIAGEWVWPGVSELLFTWAGLVASLVIAAVYVMVRQRIGRNRL